MTDNLAEARAYLAWRAPLVADPGPEPDGSWADSVAPLRWLTAALAEVERLRAEVARLTPLAEVGEAVHRMATVSDRISLEYIRRAGFDCDWWEIQRNRGWQGSYDNIWNGYTPESVLRAAGLLDEVNSEQV